MIASVSGKRYSSLGHRSHITSDLFRARLLCFSLQEVSAKTRRETMMRKRMTCVALTTLVLLATSLSIMAQTARRPRSRPEAQKPQTAEPEPTPPEPSQQIETLKIETNLV